VPLYTTARCVCINYGDPNSLLCVRTAQLIHVRLIHSCDLKGLKTSLSTELNVTRYGFHRRSHQQRNKSKYRADRPTLVPTSRTSEESNGATAVSTD